jgi:hypothetical protein
MYPLKSLDSVPSQLVKSFNSLDEPQKTNETNFSRLSGVPQHSIIADDKAIGEREIKVADDYMDAYDIYDMYVELNNCIENNDAIELKKTLDKYEPYWDKVFTFHEVIEKAYTNRQHECMRVLVTFIARSKRGEIPDYTQKKLFLYCCNNIHVLGSQDIIDRFGTQVILNCIKLEVIEIAEIANKAGEANTAKIATEIKALKKADNKDTTDNAYISIKEYASKLSFQTLYNQSTIRKLHELLLNSAIFSEDSDLFSSIFNTIADYETQHKVHSCFNDYILNIITASVNKNYNPKQLAVFLNEPIVQNTLKQIEAKDEKLIFDLIFKNNEYFSIFTNSCPWIFSCVIGRKYSLLGRAIARDIQNRSIYYTTKVLSDERAKNIISKPSINSTLPPIEMLTPELKKLLGNINNDSLRLHSSIKTAADKATSLEEHEKILTIIRSNRNSISHSEIINALNLDTSYSEKKELNRYLKVIHLIQTLPHIGLWINDAGYCLGEANKIYSFGDTNAILSTYKSLMDLGAKKINIFFATDVSLTPELKKNMQNKLRYLLNTINQNQCSSARSNYRHPIDICFVEEGDTIADEILMITFLARVCLSFKHNINNVIAIKPLLFGKIYESMYIGIPQNTPDSDKQCKNISLKNNTYSILGDTKNALPIQYIGKNRYKNWFYDSLLPVTNKNQASLLANFMNEITIRVQQGKINHSLVYGLHHYKVIYDKDIISNNWINILNKLSIENNKRSVLFILGDFCGRPIRKSDHTNIIFFNFIGYCGKKTDKEVEKDNKYIVETLATSFAEGKNIVAFLPSLPKELFNFFMIDCSEGTLNLVEGANTTTALLQYGVPYLSLLPNGNTPIPTQIGTPFENFIQEALSYKLRSSDKAIHIFTKLYSYIIDDKYEEAIEEVKQLKTIKKDPNIVAFLWKDSKKFMFEEITVLSLLTKGKSMSSLEKEYLLWALDPNIINSTVKYMTRCKDPKSKEYFSTLLKQEHVNKPVNNTLLVSLEKFVDESKKILDAQSNTSLT